MSNFEVGQATVPAGLVSTLVDLTTSAVRNSLFDILRFELDNDDFILKLPELLQPVISNPVGIFHADHALIRKNELGLQRQRHILLQLEFLTFCQKRVIIELHADTVTDETDALLAVPHKVLIITQLARSLQGQIIKVA